MKSNKQYQDRGLDGVIDYRKAEGVKSQPTQARAKLTQKRLLDTLEELLRSKSIHEISVSEIASAAGVTTGAIYTRFKDKRGLLRAASLRFSEEASTAEKLRCAEPKSDVDMIRMMLLEISAYAMRHMPLIRAAISFEDEFPLKLMESALDEVSLSLRDQIKTSPYSGKELERRCRFVVRNAAATVNNACWFDHIQGPPYDRLIENLVEVGVQFLGVESS